MGLKQAITKVRRSTLQVSVMITEGDRLDHPVIGTAFVVADGYAVTAKHVTDAIPAVLNGRQGQQMLSFAGPNVDTPTIQMRANFTGQPFQVLAEDSENDLALLKMAPLASYANGFDVGIPFEAPVPAKLATSRPDEGDPIACSGYPLAQPSLVTTTGVIASSWAIDPDVKGLADRYLADLTANPGNSGGPVYSTGDGRIVGVLVAGLLTQVLNGPGQHAASISVLVPSMTVAKLMADNGIG